MANHFSALKRARQTEKRTARNRANRSRLRTTLREFRETLAKELPANRLRARQGDSEGRDPGEHCFPLQSPPECAVECVEVATSYQPSAVSFQRNQQGRLGACLYSRPPLN